MKILPLLACATSLLFFSCAPNTPEQRILKNISLYTALPAKHQELVKRGELARGMSPEAVFIAWGNPAEKYQIMNGGISTERWDYTRNKSVYTNQIGYGIGFGGHHSYSSLYFSPEVSYIPQRSASVLFKMNKVDGWERMQ